MTRLQTEQVHCNNCGGVTSWVKHSNFEQCMGCRTRFPCVSCSHPDCRETRGEASICSTCAVIGGHLDGCEKAVDLVGTGSNIQHGGEIVSTEETK